MAEQNLVVERLKERRKSSTGMLTGWMRDLVSRHKAPGTSVAPYVPFRVPFQPLTQKTNSSSEQGSNLVHRELFNGFARSVAQKFEDTKTLVPYVSMITGEKAKAWGEVERIFPGAQSGSSRHEEPAQPGEMRSGTVIQKFDMFPKPGQTIDSFKGQSQQTTSRQRSKEAAPQKRTVTPGQRLFTRVTEITPNKPLELEYPVSETADEPDSPASIFDQPKPQPVLPEPAQPKIEPEPPVTDVPETKTSPEPVQETMAEMVSQNLPEMKPPKPSEAPVEMPLHQAPRGEEPAKPERKAAKQDEPSGKAPVALPKARPVATQTSEKLPKAVPVRKESEHQENVHKALPATVKPGRMPLHVQQSSMTSRVVQRSPDLPTTPVQKEAPQPEVGEEENVSVQPVVPPLPEMDASFSSEPRLQSDQPGEDQEPNSAFVEVEMPLRKVVQQRQQVSRGLVHSTKGVQIKQTPPQPSLVQRPQAPLFSPQKYQMELNTSRFDARGDEDAQSNVSALPLPVTYYRTLPASSQQRIAPSYSTSPEREAENRLAPSMLQKDLAVLQPSQMQAQPIPPDPFVMLNQKRQPQISTSGEMQRGASNAGAQSSNVVQRIDAFPEETAASPTPSTDLGKLADDVLPYIKRLLEIERERTRGSIR